MASPPPKSGPNGGTLKQEPKAVPQQGTKGKNSSAGKNTTMYFKCGNCYSGNHSSQKCPHPRFSIEKKEEMRQELGIPMTDGWAQVLSRNRCKNCLGQGHFTGSCPEPKRGVEWKEMKRQELDIPLDDKWMAVLQKTVCRNCLGNHPSCNCTEQRELSVEEKEMRRQELGMPMTDGWAQVLETFRCSNCLSLHLNAPANCPEPRYSIQRKEIKRKELGLPVTETWRRLLERCSCRICHGAHPTCNCEYAGERDEKRQDTHVGRAHVTPKGHCNNCYANHPTFSCPDPRHSIEWKEMKRQELGLPITDGWKKILAKAQCTNCFVISGGHPTVCCPEPQLSLEERDEKRQAMGIPEDEHWGRVMRSCVCSACGIEGHGRRNCPQPLEPIKQLVERLNIESTIEKPVESPVAVERQVEKTLKSHRRAESIEERLQNWQTGNVKELERGNRNNTANFNARGGRYGGRYQQAKGNGRDDPVDIPRPALSLGGGSARNDTRSNRNDYKSGFKNDELRVPYKIPASYSSSLRALGFKEDIYKEG